MSELPASYVYGKVIGRVIHAIADTASDSDDKPEARGAQGTVVFTPAETMRAVDDAIVLHESTEVKLDPSGHIVDAEDRPGVWLIAGQYTVQFRLQSGTIAKQTITVTTDNTAEHPLDLADIIGYQPPPTGVEVVTLVVPADGHDGQVLGFAGGSQVQWVDSGTVTWGTVDDKPTVFPPDAHTHPIGEVSGLQSVLDGLQPAGDYAAAEHTHSVADVTGLQSELDGLQPAGDYAPADHDHQIGDVVGLQGVLDGKQPVGDYAPQVHTHSISEVDGLQTELDGKQDAGSYVTGTGITEVRALTQAEYDAITPDPAVLYVITDAS